MDLRSPLIYPPASISAKTFEELGIRVLINQTQDNSIDSRMWYSLNSSNIWLWAKDFLSGGLQEICLANTYGNLA